MRENDEGADFMPMKLAVVLVAAAIVVALAGISVLGLVDGISKTTARAGAAKIAATAACEYADSCADGSGVALSGITIPGNVRMITFGAMTGTDQDASRDDMYNIQYDDGSTETYFTNVPLGADIPGVGYGKSLMIYPGRYTIHIRIGPVNGSQKALLRPEGE